MKEIRFNAPNPSPYDKAFSNFSFSPIVMDGIGYPTVEHAFQAHKTINKKERIEFKNARTPGVAKKMGRAVQLRSDWEEVKYKVMKGCLREKFKIPYYRNSLLDTEDAILIEDASRWNDCIWGTGREDNGQNLLGKALMEIREEIKNDRATEE